MGLVQLLRDVPHPDLMAGHLLDRALEDFRESRHHYLMHLVAQRDHARHRGTAEAIAAVDAQIHEHAIHEQIPQRWCLDFLFSSAGFGTFGDGLLPIWATILIQICTLEQHWEGALLGYSPENPYLLPGFHAAEDVQDTAWLQDGRRTWSEDLRAAARPDANEPDEAEELHGLLEAQTDATDLGSWLN